MAAGKKRSGWMTAFSDSADNRDLRRIARPWIGALGFHRSVTQPSLASGT
jgi:hypothetical protein